MNRTSRTRSLPNAIPAYEQRRQLRQWLARWPHQFKADLRRQHALRLHVLVIALLMLGTLLGGGLALRLAGVDALWLRYLILLPACYPIYLGLLRLWATLLLRKASEVVDFPLVDLPPAQSLAPPFKSGGGGDFGGGGASGDFGSGGASGEFGSAASPADAARLPSPPEVGAPSWISSPESSTLSSAADSDEGAVVAVPLVLVGALGFALGGAVFALFGVEVLLAVAVEVALASVAGAYAWRHQQQGWWACAVQHTLPGALVAIVAGVALGAAIDYWWPAAQSLPEAWQLWRAG